MVDTEHRPAGIGIKCGAELGRQAGGASSKVEGIAVVGGRKATRVPCSMHVRISGLGAIAVRKGEEDMRGWQYMLRPHLGWPLSVVMCL